MSSISLALKPRLHSPRGARYGVVSISSYTTQSKVVVPGLYEDLERRQLIAQATSGRNAERPIIDKDTLVAYQNELLEQVSKFFERAASQLSLTQVPTLVLNNLEWIEKISALEFLGSTGRYARLSIMLAKECVKNRLESPQGISFSEFSYQLFQAHDFWYLHQNYGCQLQVGGQDQWGNIVAGIELIHKRRTSTKEAYGLTTPLLTNAAGEKFGKSLNNALWLDSRLTSPFQFYQHFMKTPDAGLESLFKSFTFVKPETINEIIAAHYQKPEALEGQRMLAQEVTRLVHGDDGLVSAEALTDTLYNSDFLKLRAMSASDLDVAFSPERSPKDLVTSIPKDRILNQQITSVVFASGLTRSE
ncbi:tyrosyl-tRNA synthetase, partial [Massospora cicadina]